jgi:hypothetical protein
MAGNAVNMHTGPQHATAANDDDIGRVPIRTQVVPWIKKSDSDSHQHS